MGKTSQLCSLFHHPPILYASVLFIVSASAFLWPAAHSNAAIIVHDTFNDGGFSDGADPLDVLWTNVSNANLSIQAFNSSGNTGNSLSFAPTTGFPRMQANFTGQSLAVGESLNLTMDFRMPATFPNSDSTLRFALGTSSLTYGFTLPTGTTLSGALIRYNGPSLVSGASLVNLTTSGTPFSINDLLPHTFSLSITRSGASSLSLIGSIDGSNVFTGVDNSATSFLFDRIVVGSGSATASVRMDNVMVQSIPEPSAGGLAALGLLAAVSARRRARRTWAAEN